VIRARLPFTNDGKTTVIVGLTSADLDLAMLQEKPVVMSLEDIGIEMNLIILLKPHNDDLVEDVKKAAGDGDIVVIDKSNDPEFVKRAMARRLAHARLERREAERLERRKTRKRR
jgi:hypothetical protein